jgi:hypothetical protein
LTGPRSFGEQPLPLMRLHIHAPPAKVHALSLQPESLFECRVASQFDRAACAQHTLPGQSKPAPQYRRDLPRGPRKSRCPRNPAVGRHFSARNCAHRLLNPQTPRSRIILFGFCRRRPATLSLHSAITQRFKLNCNWVPHPSRVLCERVGFLISSACK